MATKVAELSADLTANTSNFETNISKARKTLKTAEQKMTKSASNIDKKISLSFQKAAQNTAAFQGPLGGVAGRLSTLASIAGSTGVVLGTLGLSITGVVLSLSKAVAVGNRFEGSMNRVQAIINTTGNSAGFTAQEIRDFAQELARGTLTSVEGVEAAAAKLMTFRSVSGDTFKKTLVLAQDLAATGFGSLTDNVTQLGKALEDPIKNLGALTRNGVSFSQVQKDLIKKLVETGKAAEAQTIILAALEQQVGGAGGAEGGALDKAYDSLTQSVDNFFMLLDKKLGLTQIVANDLAKLQTAVDNVNDSIFGNEQRAQGGPRAIELLKQDIIDYKAEIEGLLTQSTEEKGFLDRLLGDENVINNRIATLQALIATTEALIEAEEKAIESAKRKSEIEQKKIDAERLAGIEAEKRKKELKKETKAEERRQKKIKDTIRGLREEVDAIILENAFLKSNSISIEEAAMARKILIKVQELGLDINSKEARQISELMQQRYELQQLIEKEEDIRDKVSDAIEDNKTKQEELNEELKEYIKLNKEGRISDAEKEKAVKRIKKELSDLDKNQKNLKDGAKEVGKEFGRTLTDIVFRSKKASDAIKELGIRIIEIAFQRLVVNQIVNSIGTFIDNAYADGGRPAVNKVSLVGERGPELFVPDTAGTIIPNDQLSIGSGDGGGTTIYADLRGASVDAVKRLEIFVQQINASIEPRSIEAVTNAMERNPAINGKF